MANVIANKAGLVNGNDNAIYVEKDNFTKCWKVLRTKVGGCQASVMFEFEHGSQAYEAAGKIAAAIGGKFYGLTDPRK